MGLRLRFALLIALLVAVLLFVTSPIREATNEERRSVIAAAHLEARHNFDQLLQLQGEAFSRFIRDYSWWDDTFHFVTDRDLEWARVNLDGVLPIPRTYCPLDLHPRG